MGCFSGSFPGLLSSKELRLPVGVEREPFFSSRAARALGWDTGGPSRLDRFLSWFFLDLKRNAMATAGQMAYCWRGISLQGGFTRGAKVEIGSGKASDV